jgi:TetR/AcrR family transcriptional regulator, transcriptional repressor for nem operon
VSTTVRRRGPGSRADASHPTRHELLDAAVLVADRDGIDGLSVTAVTQAAGVAKGTFYVHFTDRSTLLVELHRRFHDDLFAAIAERTAGLRPGPDRARVRTIAFLDGCRRLPGVRALLLQARSEATIRDEVQRRNDQAARLLADDLRSASDVPLECARLIVAATAEAALHELDAQRALPRMRRALAALVPG